MVHPKPQSNQNSKHKQTQRNKNKDTVLLKDLVDLIEKIRLFHTEGFRHMLVYFSYLIIGQKKKLTDLRKVVQNKQNKISMSPGDCGWVEDSEYGWWYIRMVGKANRCQIRRTRPIDTIFTVLNPAISNSNPPSENQKQTEKKRQIKKLADAHKTKTLIEICWWTEWRTEERGINQCEVRWRREVESRPARAYIEASWALGF